MENIKQLSTVIQQACSDVHTEPPVQLYKIILTLLESRVDMPKHTIGFISKRLVIKNKKTLFIIFDLLQFLSYNCQLSFFSQIATKQFLFKISGILMNKDTDSIVIDKILKAIRCMDQLFRPHEDLLPLFYQFYAGLLRKQFPIPTDYVSPYRPKQLKKYKKVQSQKKQGQIPKKKTVQASKSQQKVFQQIRQKILLTNEIMDNCSPSENVKENDLLIQLMTSIKQCQKKINETINQNPNESIMELALASNDDIYITYRRFKDLQRNRKPQPFVLTQLASDYIKNLQKQKQQQKSNYRQSNNKKPSQSNSTNRSTVSRSIFDQFQQQSPKKETSVKSVPSNQSPKKQVKEVKAAQLNIFDLDITQKKQEELPKINNALDLMDIGPPQPHPFLFSTQSNGASMVNNFQLLLGSMSGQSYKPASSQLLGTNNLSNNSNVNQAPFNNQNGFVYNSQPIYGNISLQTQQVNIQKKPTQNDLTNMSDFKLFLGNQK